MTAARGLAFAAAERMIDRVHRDAAHVRPIPEPAAATGFANRDGFVIQIADLADRREALHVDLAYLARRHLYLRVGSFLLQVLHRLSGPSSDLLALSRLQLDFIHL